MMRSHFVHLVVAAIMLAVLGCKKESGNAQTPNGGAAAPVDTKPKFSLTADEFKAEIKKDEAAAKAKYNGQTTQIRGTVTGFGMAHTGSNVYVSGPIAAGGNIYDFANCVFCKNSDPEAWATLQVGQPVIVVGTALVGIGNGELDDAKFTLDGPSVMRVVSAEDYAMECAKDRDAARKKYDPGPHTSFLVVSGPVLEKKGNPASPEAVLIGTAKGSVLCKYALDAPPAEKVLGPLKVGDNVKFSGEVSRMDTKSPEMVNVRLISK
jgi:hypothetical protein